MDRLTLEKGEEKVVYIPERIYKKCGFFTTPRSNGRRRERSFSHT
jgi:hypothetical protein